MLALRRRSLRSLASPNPVEEESYQSRSPPNDSTIDSLTASSSTTSEEENNSAAAAMIYQTPSPMKLRWGLRKRRLSESEMPLSPPPLTTIAMETPLLTTAVLNVDTPSAIEDDVLTTIPRRNLFRRRPRWRRGNDATQTRRCIPADHPLKLLWDVCTVILSCIHAYRTHVSIASRNYDASPWYWCMNAWFVLDILLNFLTEHRLGSIVLRTPSAVAARYLTTWFVIDVLSLVPGEWLFVRPVIQRLQARKRWRKWLSRTQTVTRVTAKVVPRWNHVRVLSALGRRHVGLGGVARAVKAAIYYIPKYILFLRNMKAVAAVRLLRQYHWMRKMYSHLLVAVAPHERIAEGARVPHPNAGEDDDAEELDVVLDDDDEAEDIYLYEDDLDEEEDDDDDDGGPY
jgi:hypothetical protein